MLAASSFAESLNIEKFGGLDTDNSPLTYKENTPLSENVVTDIGPSLGGRQGFIVYSTQTCTGGMWEFPHSNGTNYGICATANSLRATQGNGIYNVLISTISSSDKTVVTAIGDVLYFANRTDGLKAWNTATVSVASATLKVNMLATHKGCLWAAGLGSAPRTIFKSAFVTSSSPPSWDLVAIPVATDPAQFLIAGGIDEPLTALFASFQDKLIWMCPSKFGAVIGGDRRDFETKVFSDRVGTAYPESIKDCDGFLRWLGSARTIWEFDGSRHYLISRKGQRSNSSIEGLLDTVIQGDANVRSFVITTQNDFDAGTNNLTSNSISPGSVVQATWTATDTTAADFGAGTFSNTSTNTVAGNLSIHEVNTNAPDNSFELGLGAWVSVTGSQTTAQAQSGSQSFVMDPSIGLGAFCSSPSTVDNVRYKIKSPSGATLINSNNIKPSSGGSWDQETFTLSSIEGKKGYIEILVEWSCAGGDTADSVTSNGLGTQVFSGDPMSFYIRRQTVGGHQVIYIDNFEGGISTVTTGSFTGQTRDTSLPDPQWLGSTITATANGNTISYQTQSSDDGVSWDSAVSHTPGAVVMSATKRFFRYLTTFTMENASTGYPFVSDTTFGARESTGSYVSATLSLGAITGYSTFDVDEDLNGGIISYALYTDSDTVKTITHGIPVAGTYLSSQTITSGSIPVVSTAAFAFVGSTFAISVGSHIPTVNDIVLNWSEGSTLRVAASYPSQRYWLAVAISSTSNNRVLVFDRNREWQLYNGINAVSMTRYGGVHLFSNTAGVFQAEEGYDDNGVPITSMFRTPTFSPTGPHIASKFNDLIVTMDASASTLSTSYRVNGIDTDYSLADYVMNTQTGTNDIRLPFPWTQVQRGKNIDFLWTVTGSVSWRILGATLDFTREKYPG